MNAQEAKKLAETVVVINAETNDLMFDITQQIKLSALSGDSYLEYKTDFDESTYEDFSSVSYRVLNKTLDNLYKLGYSTDIELVDSYYVINISWE